MLKNIIIKVMLNKYWAPKKKIKKITEHMNTWKYSLSLIPC